MSSFDQRPVRCGACGQIFQTIVYASVNIGRMPDARRQVLERTLNRARCDHCNFDQYILTPLLYTDFAGGLWVHCLPPEERIAFRGHEADARAVFTANLAPDNGPPIARALLASLRLRVVFGYAELREKVLCQQEGLDDAVIECLKLELLLSSPAMVEHGVVALEFEAVEDDHLVFRAAYGPGGPRQAEALDALGVPRAAYAQALAQRAQLARTRASLFESPWCNHLRYHFDEPSHLPC